MYCEHSAKQAHVHEVTPESDFVFLYSDGSCLWEPRYELSVTRCDIDVTWFPFDRQHCSLVFVSWLMTSDNIVVDPKPTYKHQPHYMPSENWHLDREYINLKTSVCGNSYIRMQYVRLWSL